MEAIDPVYGTTTLLLIAAGAVALLLFLIMKVKLHAFVSLVLVSVVTAIAVGFPLADIPDALMYGFADTLGSVALLVAFGVMLGRLLEVTGGAQVLADTLITRFGEQRAPLALGVAALLFGFPIFFDAGLVVFLPIILTVARRFGGSLLYYALPAAGAFAAMHAIVPPHPGPVAAADQLGGDIGITLLAGIPIVLLSWYFGVYLVSRFLGARVHVPVENVVFGTVRDERGRTAEQRDAEGKGSGESGGKGSGSGEAGGKGASGPAGERKQSGAGSAVADLGHRPPRFLTVLGLLLIPLVLISCDTVLDTLGTAGTLDADQGWAAFLGLLGNTPVALMITVLAAVLVLGKPRTSMDRVRTIVDEALGPICAIILITGAGGMFGGVLELSGIGSALSSSLSDLGISLILQAFIIATLLRVAQGSATVAITTTGGLIAGSVSQAQLGDFQITLLVVAIAAGATVLSHVNDSGFWLVSRFFGMDEKTTLKTWTVMETTLGVSAFLIALGLWAVF
ncbi:GntP family permease [Streptomyces oceani]|uniref:Permease n=1 Tax=Streptomyces oceani TaxID=1075402 RepID=A0A1E7KID6_9ACTN|nr:GntP family permease [Streptomyces oceani]OEV03614.1 permease [Streptomyces oceani]